MQRRLPTAALTLSLPLLLVVLLASCQRSAPTSVPPDKAFDLALHLSELEHRDQLRMLDFRFPRAIDPDEILVEINGVYFTPHIGSRLWRYSDPGLAPARGYICRWVIDQDVRRGSIHLRATGEAIPFTLSPEESTFWWYLILDGSHEAGWEIRSGHDADLLFSE